MTAPKRIALSEYHARIKAQGASCREEITLICPMCQTPQNARDFIDAGAGARFDDIEKYLGFSCVGRFLDSGSPRKQPDGKPCNWTLGGLFTLHKLEVVMPDGRVLPSFEVAKKVKSNERA